MSSGEWFNVKDKKVQKISLQPEGMESCKFVVEIIGKFFVCNFQFNFLRKVSSLQPNPQPQNKSTEQTPNIIQTFNRHGNDFDKSKQDEVSGFLFVTFFTFMFLSLRTCFMSNCLTTRTL